MQTDNFHDGVFVMPCAGFAVAVGRPESSDLIHVQLLKGERLIFEKTTREEYCANRFFVDFMTVLLVLKESRSKKDFQKKIDNNYCGCGRARKSLLLDRFAISYLARDLPCC
jgi:hypothetical protein